MVYGDGVFSPHVGKKKKKKKENKKQKLEKHFLNSHSGSSAHDAGESGSYECEKMREKEMKS